jgi:hypothetical protein
MRTTFVTLALMIVVGAATAANAAEVVTMTVIDANGVGKQIGTLAYPTATEVYGFHHNLRGYPRVTMVFTST